MNNQYAFKIFRNFLIIFCLLNLTIFQQVIAQAVDIEPTEQIKDIVKNRFSQTLKDPDSVIYRWPRWLRSRDSAVYCFWANAKNSYGGYTGYKIYSIVFSIKDGEILSSSIVGEDNNKSPNFAKEFCANFGYGIKGPPSQ